MEALETINTQTWNAHFPLDIQKQTAAALESGRIIFLPQLTFNLTDAEQIFLSPNIVDPKTKNISFDIRNSKLGGAHRDVKQILLLKEMLRRYANSSRLLVAALLPHYVKHLEIARTSFRPVEILGRPTSYRKDDTRLHVDAFPANPNQGRRILRIFTNINPEGKERLWRVGESFAKVATKFFPNLPKPFLGSAKLLQLIKLTKGLRTPYDHYMLHMHDSMKADLTYQQTAPQVEIKFPAGSTWIVYTDCVSHAAMTGQYLFEQTFHLPVQAMHDEMKSPLRILEKISGRNLL